MAGWYEFIYRESGGTFYSPTYLARDKDGLGCLIDNLISESGPENQENMVKFHPDGKRWISYPITLSSQEDIRKVDPNPKRSTIYTVHHDPLRLEIGNGRDLFNLDETLELSNDLILALDRRGMMFLKMFMEQYEKSSSQYLMIYLHSKRLMVPLELGELLSQYESR